MKKQEFTINFLIKKLEQATGKKVVLVKKEDNKNKEFTNNESDFKKFCKEKFEKLIYPAPVTKGPYFGYSDLVYRKGFLYKTIGIKDKKSKEKGINTLLSLLYKTYGKENIKVLNSDTSGNTNNPYVTVRIDCNPLRDTFMNSES